MHLASEKNSAKKGLTRVERSDNFTTIMKTRGHSTFTISRLPEKAGGLAFRKDVTASCVPHEPPAFSGFFQGENYGNARN